MSVSRGADPGISHAATRRALMDAAAEVFAEHGFRNATVREICQRAGANVAAVNYHFGDKASLYAAVLAELSRLAQDRFPSDAGLDDNATPRQRLTAFIRSFLQRVLSEDLSARHGRIMAREMVEPTEALDRMARDYIQPQADLLRDILRDLLPPGTDPALTRLCGLSIVGQILFYAHCRPVLQRLQPEGAFAVPELDRLAEHITRFSLAALDALGRHNATTPRGRSGTRPALPR
ncbi:MAG: CerR family C-terminal domain-containing protein [Verrucomicrobia bacterium]|nr:CerR family C-terminal domain-containing protein [Verrucomicrobiota bacterium]